MMEFDVLTLNNNQIEVIENLLRHKSVKNLWLNDNPATAVYSNIRQKGNVVEELRKRHMRLFVKSEN